MAFIMACGGGSVTNEQDETDTQCETRITASLSFHRLASGDTVLLTLQSLQQAYPQIIDRLEAPYYGTMILGYASELDRHIIDSLLNKAMADGIILSGLMPAWSILPENIEAPLPPGDTYDRVVNGKQPEIEKSLYELYLLRTPAIMTPTEPVTAAIEKVETPNYLYDAINMRFSGKDVANWAYVTKNNINERIAIVVDGQVASAPKVMDEITGGRAQITGNFTPEFLNEFFARITATRE